jgi:hypothetical protein
MSYYNKIESVRSCYVMILLIIISYCILFNFAYSNKLENIQRMF